MSTVNLRLALAYGLLLGLAQPLECQQPAISLLEAVHLVEFQVEGFSVVSARPGVREGVPVYEIDGRVKQDGYRALVDARVARVIEIWRNGQQVYRWPGIIAVGHRGTVRFAPENTLAAFRKAIELGLDLIEIDVRQTKDGHLVIMHDPTVDRTTNGKGRVAEMTLAEIKALDAGSWFSPEFAGERVPTLDEALDLMRGRALPDIDFKAGDPEKLVATLRRHGLLGRATLYCGDWDLMRRTLSLTRDLLLRPTVPYGGLVGLPRLIEEFDPPIVNINWREFTERLIVEVHLAGKKAFVNTMGPNDTEFGILRAIEAGADYIQSDRPDLLMPLLRARKLHQ